MFEYIEKFNKLPGQLRNQVSAPTAIAILDGLEKKYGLPLAALVVKIAVREVKLADLTNYLVQVEKLDEIKAQELAGELKNQLFAGLANYLTEAQPIADKAPINNSAKGAGFFFSPEDEAEVRELAKKVDNFSVSTATAEQIDNLLDTIINKTKINFGSAELAERFKQILRIYLRGIRNKIETKQTLLKPFSAGGLSFDNESADHVLTVVDNSVKSLGRPESIKPPPRIKIPEMEQRAVASLKSVGARDFEYDLAKLVKPEQAKQAPALDTSHEIAPPPPTVVKPTIVKRKTVPIKQKSEILEEPKAISRPPVEPDSKVRLADVKFVPRIMGPIDELKFLDLVNWRRLGGEPAKAAEKIIEKINLLEEESYSKRLEGIRAWRLSPVNKLYLEMGQASISLKQPINVIIKEREKRGQEYLTSQEFEAIMDMNKQLRF